MEIKIENTPECYVMLWTKLRDTYELFHARYTRFCVRRILKNWLPESATDDLIWEVCYKMEVEGLTELPDPEESPRVHRNFLLHLLTVYLKLNRNKIDTKALDKAYNKAYPLRPRLRIRK